MSHALQALWWVCHYLVKKSGQLCPPPPLTQPPTPPMPEPVQGCRKTFCILQINKTHSTATVLQRNEYNSIYARTEKIRWRFTDRCGETGSLQRETFAEFKEMKNKRTEGRFNATSSQCQHVKRTIVSWAHTKKQTKHTRTHRCVNLQTKLIQNRKQWNNKTWLISAEYSSLTKQFIKKLSQHVFYILLAPNMSTQSADSRLAHRALYLNISQLLQTYDNKHTVSLLSSCSSLWHFCQCCHVEEFLEFEK